jgi:uncharacterized protein YgbK (DUF1537 family)
MSGVRALADDLTGAFDAGAAFVGMCGPLPICWRDYTLPKTASFILDNETRNEGNVSVAVSRTQAQLALLDWADIAFKKIDSLMRGHTFDELRACIDSGRFGSVVIAPAFPAQGRVTHGGQQFANFSGTQWESVGPNLLGRLADCIDGGMHHLGPADRATGGGVFVCDATTEADMLSLRERLAGVDEPRLWCGSAGLARALSNAPTVPCRLPPGSSLMIVGSNHLVSERQVATLKLAMPDSVCDVDMTCGLDDVCDFARRRLEASDLAVIAMAFGAVSSSPAHQRMANVLTEVLPALPVPNRLIVTGGETLLLTLEAVGARSAIVKGELIPGIAIGEAVGGIWDGVTFLSKSGAFGASSLLLELLADGPAEVSS